MCTFTRPCIYVSLVDYLFGGAFYFFATWISAENFRFWLWHKTGNFDDMDVFLRSPLPFFPSPHKRKKKGLPDKKLFPSTLSHLFGMGRTRKIVRRSPPSPFFLLSCYPQVAPGPGLVWIGRRKGEKVPFRPRAGCVSVCLPVYHHKSQKELYSTIGV